MPPPVFSATLPVMLECTISAAHKHRTHGHRDGGACDTESGPPGRDACWPTSHQAPLTHMHACCTNGQVNTHCCCCAGCHGVCSCSSDEFGHYPCFSTCTLLLAAGQIGVGCQAQPKDANLRVRLRQLQSAHASFTCCCAVQCNGPTKRCFVGSQGRVENSKVR